MSDNILKEQRSNLSNKCEAMVQLLINKYVIKDKTFRISAPADMDTIKKIFSNMLSEKQLNTLAKYDGIFALFVEETSDDSAPREVKPDSVNRRRQYKEQAQPVIGSLSEILGKPVLEVWSSTDRRQNVFGASSFYICCMFALNDDTFASII